MKAKLTLEIIDDLENIEDGKKIQSYSDETDINVFQLTSMMKAGIDPIESILQSLVNGLRPKIKIEV
jgi:hypothetical protein